MFFVGNNWSKSITIKERKNLYLSHTDLNTVYKSDKARKPKDDPGAGDIADHLLIKLSK